MLSIKSLTVGMISLLLSCTSFAATLNMLEVTQNYFPSFNGQLEATSSEGLCKLSIRTDGKTVSYELAVGTRSADKFVSPVVLIKGSVLAEQVGRKKDQGYYSYTNFYGNSEITTVVQGSYYYEPNYDPTDSTQYTVAEQKLTLEKTTAGTVLKFTQRTADLPRTYTCRF